MATLGARRSSFGATLEALACLRVQLAAPERQSEYFRLGFDSNRGRLAMLTAEAFRAAFNGAAVDDLRASLANETDRLVRYQSFEPRFVRAVL